jgi:hypothetical protein
MVTRAGKKIVRSRPMPYQHILIDDPRPRVRRITLNPPEKRNALNNRLRAEIFEALEAADRDGDVSISIIRGAGSCFSPAMICPRIIPSISPIIRRQGPANGRAMSSRVGSRSGTSLNR